MPNKAIYASPTQVQDARAGDPLGLGATNMRLYNAVFPGFNNFTKHILAYSSLCWVAYNLERVLGDEEAITPEVFAKSREKMELVVGWVNRNALGLPGSTRKFPDSGGWVELQFGSFDNSQATLFTDATYKPSITNGLQLLRRGSSGGYVCTDKGRALAEALDYQLKGLEGYRWLCAIDKLNCRQSLIDTLSPALDVNKPSKREQKSFLSSFYPEEVTEREPGAEGAFDRKAALTLMMNAIETINDEKAAAGELPGATEDEIRATMASGRAPGGTCVPMGQSENVQGWWAVLQVRQLQRLATEALYCEVERWISRQGVMGQGTSSLLCAEDIWQAFATQWNALPGLRLNALLTELKNTQGEYTTLYEAAVLKAGGANPGKLTGDLFGHMRRLQQQKWGATDPRLNEKACAEAIAALVFCAVETDNLKARLSESTALEADMDRCSLLRLSDLARVYKDRPLAEFVRYLVRDWVIERHFEVACMRSETNTGIPDGKNRFMFSEGDRGLERRSLSAEFPKPSLGGDKLHYALALFAQSGMIENKGGYQLTENGRRRCAVAMERVLH
ncbi:hypothetical protein LC612_28340 [Nostoc sp. CHAB 5834]|nr:hypothetical protein [Nostoc sp. CHAB 5834]